MQVNQLKGRLAILRGLLCQAIEPLAVTTCGQPIAYITFFGQAGQLQGADRAGPPSQAAAHHFHVVSAGLVIVGQ